MLNQQEENHRVANSIMFLLVYRYTTVFTTFFKIETEKPKVKCGIFAKKM